MRQRKMSNSKRLALYQAYQKATTYVRNRAPGTTMTRDDLRTVCGNVLLVDSVIQQLIAANFIGHYENPEQVRAVTDSVIEFTDKNTPLRGAIKDQDQRRDQSLTPSYYVTLPPDKEEILPVNSITKKIEISKCYFDLKNLPNPWGYEDTQKVWRPSGGIQLIFNKDLDNTELIKSLRSPELQAKLDHLFSLALKGKIFIDHNDLHDLAEEYETARWEYYHRQHEKRYLRRTFGLPNGQSRRDLAIWRRAYITTHMFGMTGAEFVKSQFWWTRHIGHHPPRPLQLTYKTSSSTPGVRTAAYYEWLAGSQLRASVLSKPVTSPVLGEQHYIAPKKIPYEVRAEKSEQKLKELLTRWQQDGKAVDERFILREYAHSPHGIFFDQEWLEKNPIYVELLHEGAFRSAYI